MRRVVGEAKEIGKGQTVLLFDYAVSKLGFLLKKVYQYRFNVYKGFPLHILPL